MGLNVAGTGMSLCKPVARTGVSLCKPARVGALLALSCEAGSARVLRPGMTKHHALVKMAGICWGGTEMAGL